MTELFIDAATGRLVNILAPYKGRSRLDTPEIRSVVGVVAISPDAPPDEYNTHPDWYSVREDWEATQRPYIIYERKEQPEIDALERAKAKQKRAETVEALKVTTTSGKEFDGDETSQDRMAKAIQVSEITGITECTWVLANNVPTTVTVDELKEALAKSVQAMGAAWSEPYL